jgi:hypothetical protein
MPTHACTFNLHMVATHLPWQELQTGAIPTTSEWFVERGIQAMKAKTTNGKLSRNPEKLIVNDLLVQKALIERARENPEFESLVGLTEPEERQDFKGYTDKGDPTTGEQLLHVGKLVKLKKENWDGLAAMATSLDRCFERNVCKVYQFSAARNENGVLQSKAHLRTVSRESFHVAVSGRFGSSGQVSKRYARVLRYPKVVANEDEGSCIRAAEVLVFGQAKKLDTGVEVIEEAAPEAQLFVTLSALQAKVIFATGGKEKGTFVLPTFTGKL